MLGGLLLTLLGFSSFAGQSVCHEPECFGLCNPYVPGIRISGEDFLPVRVLDTWPFGPAERAGICAGDKVVAVNGVLCSKEKFERVLREIVQASPERLTLRIDRNGREFEVNVVPVRESELVAYTGRKFFRKTPVALAQEMDGFERIDRFLERVGEPFGLKNFEGIELWCSSDLADEDLRLIVTAQRTWRQQRRVVGIVPAFKSGDDWSTGASVILLSRPSEVIVIQCLPGSPAYRKGVRLGDQILRVGPVEITSDSVLQTVRETLQSGNQARRIELTICGRSSRQRRISFETSKALSFGGQELDPITGRPLSLVSFTADQTSELWITGISLLHDKRSGEAIISEIGFPSPAFDSGLLVGDQILSVNGTGFAELSEKELEECTKPGSAEVIRLEIRRGTHTMNLAVTPETPSAALKRIGRKPTAKGPCPLSCCPE